jgi:membrane-associated protease RseP (regulator of RpoE activity)
MKILLLLLAFVGYLSAADKVYFGVISETVDPALAYNLSLPEDQGVLIRAVMDDGPAAEAGIEKYDVLVALDDQPLASKDMFVNILNSCKAGEELKVDLIRKTKKLSLKLVLGAIPKVNGPELQIMKADVVQIMISDELNSTIDYDGLRIELNPETQKILESLAKTQALLEGGVRVAGSGVGKIYSYDKMCNIQISVQKDGQKTIYIENHQGESLYKGPLNKEEDLQKVPEELRLKVQKLSKLVLSPPK